MTNVRSWDTIAASVAARTTPGFETVHYGPGGPTEAELRLLGSVSGARVLDLGCGTGHAAITMARAGAHVVAVDASEQMLVEARRLAREHEAAVEWHHADLADLAFLRGQSVDAAVCIDTLPEVEDADRLLRQVHRVLKPGAPLVCSYEHPMRACLGRDAPAARDRLPLGALVVRRSYFAEGPVTVERDDIEITVWPRTLASVFASLHRAGYRVDQLLEPAPADAGSDPAVPSLVVWRARREGS